MLSWIGLEQILYLLSRPPWGRDFSLTPSFCYTQCTQLPRPASIGRSENLKIAAGILLVQRGFYKWVGGLNNCSCNWTLWVTRAIRVSEYLLKMLQCAWCKGTPSALSALVGIWLKITNISCWFHKKSKKRTKGHIFVFDGRFQHIIKNVHSFHSSRDLKLIMT